uniref:Uncharacterized protein n=1 Tax=Panagrolaimus superbus TaxID=310955 RepID=A0A914Y8E5_9BILA
MTKKAARTGSTANLIQKKAIKPKIDECDEEEIQIVDESIVNKRKVISQKAVEIYTSYFLKACGFGIDERVFIKNRAKAVMKKLKKYLNQYGFYTLDYTSDPDFAEYASTSNIPSSRVPAQETVSSFTTETEPLQEERRYSNQFQKFKSSLVSYYQKFD